MNKIIKQLNIKENLFGIDIYNTDNLIPVRSNLEKYYLPFEDKNLKDHYQVCKIYIINSHNKESIEFSDPLKGKEKFNKVEKNAYRRRYIKGLNKKKEFFTTVMRLLSNVEVKAVI